MGKSREKKLLVFASKFVGLETVRYLWQTGSLITKLIIARADDRDLLRFAQKKHIKYSVYSKSAISALLSSRIRYDWLLNLWSPHILPDSVLKLAAHRMNLHPSLVPLCRGNDQAVWTILNRCQAGVTLLEMSARVDEGDIWAQKEIPYPFPLRGQDLHGLLQKECVKFFKANWPKLYLGKLRLKKPAGKTTKYKRSQTERSRVFSVNSEMTAEELIVKVLAHDFAPRSTAECLYRGRRFKLLTEFPKKG